MEDVPCRRAVWLWYASELIQSAHKHNAKLFSLSLGFDTASSIALLAVSAIAKKDSDGNQISASNVVILPVRLSYHDIVDIHIDSLYLRPTASLHGWNDHD